MIRSVLNEPEQCWRAIAYIRRQFCVSPLSCPTLLRGKQIRGLLRMDRHRKVMPLGEFAPESPPFCRLLSLLHFLGNQLQIQIPAQSDNGLDDSIIFHHAGNQ